MLIKKKLSYKIQFKAYKTVKKHITICEDIANATQKYIEHNPTLDTKNLSHFNLIIETALAEFLKSDNDFVKDLKTMEENEVLENLGIKK